MSLELISNLYPLKPEGIKPYLNKGINPPLDVLRIRTTLLLGDTRRSQLDTPYTGDGSLVLSYMREGKLHEGLVVSFQQTARDLLVLQIQGARSRASYRLTTGINLEVFVTDQIRRIGCFLNRSGQIDRIAFPSWISGLEGAASENVFDRYERIMSRLGLASSPEEELMVGRVRDLRRKCLNPCPVCPANQ